MTQHATPAVSGETTPPTPKKKRTWRRRITIAAVVVVVLAVVFRIILGFALPSVLSRVASALNLDLKYRFHAITLIGGDAKLWGLTISPKGGGDPLLTADYIHGRISTWELLKGNLHVIRAQADEVDVLLERTADGRLPLLERLASPPTTAPAKAEPASKADSPITFTPPLVIEAIRLNKISTRVRDSVQNGIDETFTTDVRLSDIGVKDKPVRIEVDAWSDRVLDSMQLRGLATVQPQSIDLNAHVSLRGLHPKALSGYLEPQGLRPRAESLSASMSAKLNAKVVQNAAPGALSASLLLNDIALAADGEPSAGVKQVRVDVDSVTGDAICLGTVSVEGVRAAATRTPEGNLRAAGFDLVTATAQPAPAQPATQPTPIAIRELRVRDVVASFDDAAVEPRTSLRFVINDLTATNTANASDPNAPLTVNASMAAPGIAKTITLTGTMVPLGTRSQADLSFRADGIRPDALEPYLRAIGVQSKLQNASAHGAVKAIYEVAADGTTQIGAKISKLALSDGQEVVALDGIDLEALTLSPTGDRVAVTAVEIRGPKIDIVRDADGSLDLLGFHVQAASTQPAPSRAVAKSGQEASPVPPASRPAPVLPHIEVGRFTWKGVQVRLRDQSTSPATPLDVSDAGIELRDLVFDVNSTTASHKKGSISAWLKSPQLAETLGFTGTLMPKPGAFETDLKIRGTKLNLTSLAPYLQPLGIEPIMSNGSLQADARVAIATGKDQSFDATFELTKATLAEANDELLGLDGVKIAQLNVSPTLLTVGDVRISAPRATVTRDQDGALRVAGVRIKPAAPATQPAAQAAAPAPLAEPSTRPAPQPTADVFAIALNKFRLEGGTLRWIDQAIASPVDVSLRADVDLDRLTVGRKAPPASLAVRLAADNVLQSLTVAGTIDASPNAESMRLDIDSHGIQAGPLAAYFPPGMSASLRDGRLKTTFEASHALHPQGGDALKLAVRDFQYRDGAESPLLLGWTAMVLSAPRVDPAGDVFAIEEISISDVQAAAEIDAEGATRALGLVFALAPEAQPIEPVPAAQPDANPPVAAPVEAPPQTQQDVARLVAEARRPLPLFTLGKLDLHVARATFLDVRNKDAEPLVVSDVRFKNAEPITFGGASIENQPPIRFEVAGKASPVINQFGLTAQASLLATEPSAEIRVFANGIEGKGLTDILPQLASQIDGTGLTDGRFRAAIKANAKFGRRGPRDFGLSRGFDLDLLVSELALRDGEDGPVLAGVEAIEATAVRVEPATGRVRAKAIEITKPIARATRDKEGLHVLGLTLIETPATTQPAEVAPPSDATTEKAPPGPPPTTQELAAAKAGEVRVDRLIISGLDVQFEDTSVEPAVRVPLNSLDLEVRDFTTLALVEARPIRFNVVVGAGKVPLPKLASGAGVPGAVGGAVQLLSGKQPASAPAEDEQRELFSQITASGDLTLYPQPRGFAKASANGVELAAFRGFAQQAGIDLSAGVFDGTVDLRLRDSSEMNARTKLVVTDLKVSEPANGPISRQLKLPAPLDTVLAVLRDADGSITIPLNIPIEDGNVSVGAIAGSAVGALTQVIATAIASSPVKLAGGVGGLVGLGAGDKSAKNQKPPVPIAFAAGDVELDASNQDQIAELIRLMRSDGSVQLTLRHELGSEDVSILQARANPSAADTLALAERLRAQKIRLLAQRAELAGRTRASVAAWAPSAAPDRAIEQLRELDRQIAQIEDGLDQLYELLRPGADRQAVRRTRAACLQIAERRVAAVRDALVASGVRNASDRVRATPATFSVAEDNADGVVTVTIVRKKRS